MKTMTSDIRGTERACLRPLLSPRSVAVVGAMQRHGSAGYETVHALRDFGFRGRLYPVSGSGRPVSGVPGYRTIADLPGPVDLLLVAAPTDRVPGVLREAGRHGVRCAVVLAHGHTTAEPGPRRQELLRIAREHGVRLVGPNSLGVVNTDPLVLLDAGLAPVRPPAGGLAMAAQSGAVGIALLEQAAREGCGVASFVSLGDQVEVSANDLIGHWHGDPRVRAIALYLDSYGNTGTFARLARVVTRRKPILTVCAGEAADARDALFERAGVIRAGSVDEMMDAARMLVDQPLPPGRRLGVVGNAGGLVTLAAETARAYGFTVPGGAVDTGIEAAPRRVAESVASVLRDGGLDALLLVVAGTRANVPDAITAAVAAVVDPCPRLATAAVLTGCADDIHHIGTRRTPVYRQPDRAIRALAHARRYAARRRAPAKAHDAQLDQAWVS